MPDSTSHADEVKDDPGSSLVLRDPEWDEVRRVGGRAMHLDRYGTPISLRKWMELEDLDWYKRLARTLIRPGDEPAFEMIDVSTIWLGIDTEIYGPPLIFETMVFQGRETLTWGSGKNAVTHAIRSSRFCTRWPTMRTAREGHANIVRAIAGQLADPQISHVRAFNALTSE